MAYSSGSLILDDDYNIFATGNAAGTGDHNVANINTVWGAGTTEKGYGQSTTLSAVAAGGVVSATQWSTMLSRISTIASHQGSTITAITSPVTGDTINAYAALSTNITTIYNNRGNAAANGTDITAGGAVSGTTSFYIQAQVTTTVTFANADSARYFFNAGGMIRITPTRSGVTYSKDTDWNNLATACGTIAFTGGAYSQTIAGTAYTGTTKIGGSGTPNTHLTTTGYYDLTPGGAATLIFKQFSGGGTNYYYNNYISLTVALSANSTVLTFVMTFRDDDMDVQWYGTEPNRVQTGPSGQEVTGTTGMAIVVRPPSETNITKTWGTPTMSGSIAYT